MKPGPILVVRNDKLGDFVLAWPALALLRASLPEARLDVLVPAYTRELAAACPSVDGVVLDPGPGAGSGALARVVRAGGYAAALTLFSTTRVGLALWRARVPYRLAPATKLAQVFYGERLIQRRSRSAKPEFEYNADLARHYVRRLGRAVVEPAPPYLTFPPAERAAVEADFRARHGLADERLVLLHAGSGGSAANLSHAGYARFARALASDRGHAVVLTAGPGERPAAEALAARLAGLRVVLHESRAGLVEFAKLVAAADVFVAGSTGTLHVAGALDVPTAAFYPRRRSSTPLRWQTLNRAGRRLAWSPDVAAGESDLEAIDVEAAAREVSRAFLGA
ncbi:MAG: glycosyltransferase family 9 protein [Planctomycetes bacterium]|nr:glycosyltransferase family 9 protein [Planctomycetota bacterium]